MSITVRRVVFLAVLLAGRSLAALPPGVVRVEFPALSIASAADGTLYAGKAGGIWRLSDEGAAQIVATGQIVYALAAAPDGSLLFVTPDQGLSRYSAGAVTLVDPTPSNYQGLLVTEDGA